MRVAYVCLDPGVPVFGRKGSSVHCQEVMRALRQRGFEIELFATKMGQDVPPDLQDRRALQCAPLTAIPIAANFIAHEISRTLVPPLPQIVECPCVSFFDTLESLTRQGTAKSGGGILRNPTKPDDFKKGETVVSTVRRRRNPTLPDSRRQ